jgi:hypothetical protein
MRTFLHALPLRLLGLLLAASLTLFLGGSYAAKDDPPAKGDKPAKDGKGDKPAAEGKGDKPPAETKDDKKDKPEEPKPPTFRVEVILRQGLPETLETKPDLKPDPKQKTTPDEGDRTQRYAALLKNENLAVRKRAALVLLGLKDQKARLDVFPALLELANEEKNLDLSNTLSDKLNGPEAVYTTPEKIDALMQALANPDTRSGLRQVACDGLGLIYGSPLAGERKPKIRAALEEGLLDAAPEVQTTAAESLELCDAWDHLKADPKKAAVKRTVYLRLNRERLLSLQQRPQDVLAVIKKRFPRLGAQLANDETTIECRASEIETVLLRYRIRLDDKNGTRLNNLARVEIVPEEEPK